MAQNNIFTDLDCLIGQIKSDLTSFTKNRVILGIDGGLGVGKTKKVAPKLKEALRTTVVSLDDFRGGNKNQYVNSLKVREIQSRLNNLTGTVLVEGVCLLAAAKKCKIEIDKFIYVKSYDKYGDWRDAEELEISQEPEKIISEIESKFSVRLIDLRKEIIHYHSEFTPYLVADYEFQVLET